MTVSDKPVSRKVCKDGFLSLREDFNHGKVLSPRNIDELKYSLTFQKSLSLHKHNHEKQQEKMHSETLKSLKFSHFPILS